MAVTYRFRANDLPPFRPSWFTACGAVKGAQLTAYLESGARCVILLVTQRTSASGGYRTCGRTEA
jgi:hypothetical protein